MYIHKIKVKNFRLLLDSELALEEETTLIVGRNNSGKTSLAEVMRRFLADSSASFQLEDFSSASYECFSSALKAQQEGADEPTVRELLPIIELRLHVKYDRLQAELGPLAPFIVDLDPDCTEAVAVVRYELKDGGISTFFEGMPTIQLVAENPQAFFRLIRERIPKQYAIKIWAEDPNDHTNRRQLQPADLRHLVKTKIINAQRGLDDVTVKGTDVLAKLLEELFSTASSNLADGPDKLIADALVDAVQEIQDNIDQNFGNQLKNLLPALKNFGYPGLGGQELQTETRLNVSGLLSGFTKVRYAGHGGVALPEGYNGLGVRNLVLILLQIVSCYKAYRAESTAPGIHLIFIEEPEAHLHPQMQEVFIRQLDKVAKQLVAAGEPGGMWPVQFVVSTHSSHIANEVSFENVRYFLSVNIPDRPDSIRHTKIKDLRVGMADKPELDKNFLHQYLTLTRCDLFFADRAVLVEGVSERLLLPVIIKKMEEAEPSAPKISSQYNTVMEVGGAYAHIFFDLLNFLELRTLVITDLDAVKSSGGESCAVHEGTATSNACIKHWFSGETSLTLDCLKAKNDQDKINGRLRIAFQHPEQKDGPCGRTFEDAFILANKEKFALTNQTANELETAARALAKKVKKKSEFALLHAIMDTAWVAPKYIVDGIRWLASSDAVSTEVGQDTSASGTGQSVNEVGEGGDNA